MKHLYRSRHKKVLGGVMGGMGDYFNIDPTLLRFIYAGITIFSGFAPGVLLYVLALFIIKEEPKA